MYNIYRYLNRIRHTIYCIAMSYDFTVWSLESIEPWLSLPCLDFARRQIMIIQNNTFLNVFVHAMHIIKNTKLSLEHLKYICLQTCMTGEGVYLSFPLSHLLHCHIIAFDKLFNRWIAIQLSGKYKQNVDILSEGLRLCLKITN
jgi:hypothetical protein